MILKWAVEKRVMKMSNVLSQKKSINLFDEKSSVHNERKVDFLSPNNEQN
jgi:hypothetical protein